MTLNPIEKMIIQTKREKALKPTVDADQPSEKRGMLDPVAGDRDSPFYRGVITCKHCNKLVPDTPYCIYCGELTE